jgi:hypothetical protein
MPVFWVNFYQITKMAVFWVTIHLPDDGGSKDL